MKLVPLSTLFYIEYGNQLDFNKMVLATNGHESINFVSRASNNFGIVGRVVIDLKHEPYDSGLITVTLGGSYLLASFVQPECFYTAQNIKVLKPKHTMLFSDKLFYCLCIQQNRFRYSSHGREANVSLNNLLVPDTVPQRFEHHALEDVVRELSQPCKATKIALKMSKWEYFPLDNLFTIKGTKTTPLRRLGEYGKGIYPYVTTQASHNGVAGFFDFKTEDGNVLTVDSAVAGYCSYQSKDFSASDHVEKLIPKFHLNKYVALFLTTILNREQYRYNYGRKASQGRMRGSEIKLPANNGNPDFDFMEQYIKSLPYSRSL